MSTCLSSHLNTVPSRTAVLLINKSETADEKISAADFIIFQNRKYRNSITHKIIVFEKIIIIAWTPSFSILCNHLFANRSALGFL